jgi:hypothetical protein
VPLIWARLSATYLALHRKQKPLTALFLLVRGLSGLVGDTGFEPVTSSVSEDTFGNDEVSGLRTALKDEPTSIGHLCRLTGVRCSIRRARSQDGDGATACGTGRAPTGWNGSQRELISRSSWPIRAGRAWVAPGSNPPSRTSTTPGLTWGYMESAGLPEEGVHCPLRIRGLG